MTSPQRPDYPGRGSTLNDLRRCSSGLISGAAASVSPDPQDPAFAVLMTQTLRASGPICHRASRSSGYRRSPCPGPRPCTCRRSSAGPTALRALYARYDAEKRVVCLGLISPNSLGFWDRVGPKLGQAQDPQASLASPSRQRQGERPVPGTVGQRCRVRSDGQLRVSP